MPTKIGLHACISHRPLLAFYLHLFLCLRIPSSFSPVALVTQQSSYIKAHTPLNVGQYFGEMGVNSCGANKWSSELESNHILVMTRQIFLDILSHGISISRVNLIIFDKCHRAVKNDP